LPALRRLFP